jgi:indolepyruvate ferredoxin oxidoreductase alpha subunit
MVTPRILRGSPGDTVMLLGNEAIARGFLEGGLQLAASYPGTPSSEIMQAILDASNELDIYAEWSVNEKVAAEVAIAASMSGLRSMTSMKGVGVNVASEPIQAFTYMAAKGGMVMVSADDVSMYSSHTEQDNRFFAREAYLPVFEPSDPVEAKEMAKTALEFSEKWRQPVFFRITTRIAHTSADIVLGEIPKRPRKGAFERQPTRWVNLPANARQMRKALLERLDSIGEDVEEIPFNRFEGVDGVEHGIIACGVTYGTVKESLRILGREHDVLLLKLGTPYPLPKKMVKKLLASTKEVLVVEEVEPFVETMVASIANKSGIHTKVLGKEHLPRHGEIMVEDMIRGLCSFMNVPVPKDFSRLEILKKEASALTLPRPPVLCPGCGHRTVFYAINLVERKLKRKSVKPSDIGCYTLGYQHPLNAVDAHLCMGGSIGSSSGFAKSVDDPVISTIGDSTFFHAGIPPLINAVFNNANITVVILDNGTTAMTGHQPHPGVGVTGVGEETKDISIEEVVRAIGIPFMRVKDTFDLPGLVEAIKEAVEFEGPSVVIAKGPCAILDLRARRRQKEKIIPYIIDYDLCTGCNVCVNKFGCPAIYLEEDKVVIDNILCVGCGVCSDKLVCPKGAIRSSDESEKSGET